MKNTGVAAIVDLKALEDLGGTLQLPIRLDANLCPGAERMFILWAPARQDQYRMIADYGEECYREIEYKFTDEDKRYIMNVAKEYDIA